MIGMKNDQDSFNVNFLIQSFVYSLIVSKIIFSKCLNFHSIVSVSQSIYPKICAYLEKRFCSEIYQQNFFGSNLY